LRGLPTATEHLPFTVAALAYRGQAVPKVRRTVSEQLKTRSSP
jgi:hypothetical protein